MDGKPLITRVGGRWYVRDPWYGMLIGPFPDYQAAKVKACSLAIRAARVTRHEVVGGDA